MTLLLSLSPVLSYSFFFPPPRTLSSIFRVFCVLKPQFMSLTHPKTCKTDYITWGIIIHGRARFWAHLSWAFRCLFWFLTRTEMFVLSLRNHSTKIKEQSKRESFKQEDDANVKPTEPQTKANCQYQCFTGWIDFTIWRDILIEPGGH